MKRPRNNFGRFKRGIRVTGGWQLPQNSSDQVKWKDVTADEWGSDSSAEPKRPWPEMRGRK